MSLDDLRLDVHGPSRLVSFTNKGDGYFLTETNAEPSARQGWYEAHLQLFRDYRLFIDGKEQRKTDVHLAMVWPHQLRRAYPTGVQETVTLLDSISALVVTFEKIKGTTAKLVLSLPIAPQDPTRAGNIWVWKCADPFPRWLALAIPEEQVHSAEMADENTPSPQWSVRVKEKQLALLFASADSREQALQLARDVVSAYPHLIERRKERMADVLRRAQIRTDDVELDRALAWAIVSLDGLIRLRGNGITAGIPNDGALRVRDCLISIPGALLVHGRYDEARAILRAIAQYQDRNPQSPTAGLIPSDIRGKHRVFASADVTPLFVSTLYEYARHSNDTTFMKELYPIVKLSIESSLRLRTDKNYFLKHGTMETLQGRPAGERASDLQALWSKQLQLGAVMASFMGEHSLAERWNEIANQVGQYFNNQFVSANGLVYSSLPPPDTARAQLHPSLLYTFDLLDHPYKRTTLFRQVTEALVHNDGVHLPGKGALVWINGVWVDLAAYFDMPELAFKVTHSLGRQILEGRVAGTLPEMLPLDTESHSSVVSHSAALAEFVRTFYQSYLGVYVDGSVPRLILKPQLPATVKRARIQIPIETFRAEMWYRVKDEEGAVEIVIPPHGKNTELHLAWNLGNGVQRQFDAGVDKGSTTLFTIKPEKVEKEVNGVTVPVHSIVLKMIEPEPLRLASER